MKDLSGAFDFQRSNCDESASNESIEPDNEASKAPGPLRPLLAAEFSVDDDHKTVNARGIPSVALEIYLLT
jgi:hypothetical protein